MLETSRHVKDEHDLLYGFLLSLQYFPYLFDKCSVGYDLINLYLTLAQLLSNQVSSDLDAKDLNK